MPKDEFNTVTVTNESQIRGVEFGGTQNTEFSFGGVKRSGINDSSDDELNDEIEEVKDTTKHEMSLQDQQDLIEQATESSNASAPSTAPASGSGATASTSGATASAASSGAATTGVATTAGASVASTVAAAGTVVVAALTVTTAAPILMSKATATLKHFEASESEIFYEVELKDVLEDEHYYAILKHDTYEKKQELTIEPEQEFVTGIFVDLEAECDYTFTVIEGETFDLTRELLSKTIRTEPVPIPEPAHEHTFSTEWTSDETYHWHASTCGHDEVSDKAEHTFGEWVTITESTTEEQGLKRRTCSVCGYVEEELLPLHVHTYSEEYEYDDTYHWHNSTCGHDVISTKEEHNYGEWVITTEAGVTTDGSKSRTCQDCGYVQTETIPMTGQSQIKAMTLSSTASFYENSISVTLDYIDDFNQYDKFELLLSDSSGFTFIYELNKESNGEAQWIEVSDFTDYIGPNTSDAGEMRPDEGGPDIMSNQTISYTFRYYIVNDSESHTFDSGSIVFEDPDYVPPFSYSGISFGYANFEDSTVQVTLSYTGNIDDVYALELQLMDDENEAECNATLIKTNTTQDVLMNDGLDLEHGTFSYTLTQYDIDMNPTILDSGDNITFTDINGNYSGVKDITFDEDGKGHALYNSVSGTFTVTVDYDDYYGYIASIALLLTNDAPTGEPLSNTFYLEMTDQPQVINCLEYMDLIQSGELTYELEYSVIGDEEHLAPAKSGTVTFADGATPQVTDITYGNIVYDGSYYLPFKFTKGEKNDSEAMDLYIRYGENGTGTRKQ